MNVWLCRVLYLESAVCRCVGLCPSLLAAWPDASQCWSHRLLSGARSWCQMRPPGERVPTSPLMSPPWALALRVSQPSAMLPPRGPPRPAGVSGPCAHEVPAFFLDPGAHEWSVPSECRVSIFPVLWSACNQALLAFKGKCSGGSSSCCQTPQAVQPDMGL